MLIQFRYSDRGDELKMSLTTDQGVFKIMKQPGAPDVVTTHKPGDQAFADWLSKMLALGMWACNQPRVMTQIPQWMRDQLKLE